MGCPFNHVKGGNRMKNRTFKKLSAMFLSILMCLLLVACAGEEAAQDGNTEADDTASISQDESSVLEESEGITEESEVSTVTEEKAAEYIEITTENWQDYFEIQYLEQIWDNDDGSVDNVYVLPYICIKEGYCIPEGEENEVNLEFATIDEWRFLYFDLTTQKATIGEAVPGERGGSEENVYDAQFTHGTTGTVLTGIATTGSAWVKDIGEYTLDNLYHLSDGWVEDEENGGVKLAIPRQLVPMNFECTAASGKVVPVE